MRRRDLVFMHIPKAAGTSLRNALVRPLGEAGYEAVFDYPNNAIGTDWLNRRPAGMDAAEHVRAHFAADRRVFLTGHFNAAKYLGGFHPASFFFFLRHPFDQVFSHYNHWRTRSGYMGCFEEFFHEERFINVQSGMAGGLDLRAAGYVGIFEDMTDDVPRLSKFLGVPLAVGRANPGAYDGMREEAWEMHGAAVMELNAGDVELYEQARALKKSGNSPGPNVASQGRCNWVSLTEAIGWATIGHGEGFATVVAVDERGTTIDETVADMFRPGLRANGIVPHGVAGFRLTLPGGVDCSRVRLIVRETGKELLAGSPP